MSFWPELIYILWFHKVSQKYRAVEKCATSDFMTDFKMSDVAPKRILTLDGSGLHALSVLTVLDTLCTSIAVQNNLPRKPAPYELFDVIGGVGMVG